MSPRICELKKSLHMPTIDKSADNVIIAANTDYHLLFSLMVFLQFVEGCVSACVSWKAGFGVEIFYTHFLPLG
jgi:hypothetical protein